MPSFWWACDRRKLLGPADLAQCMSTHGLQLVETKGVAFDLDASRAGAT